MRSGFLQKKCNTHLVSTVARFRRLAQTLPQENDIVLEVGCSLGVTTEILAKTNAKVFAFDHSYKTMKELQKKFLQFTNVTMWRHDARDIHGLLKIVPEIDYLFFDVGGNVPAHEVVFLLQLYLAAYQPKVAVIRNIPLSMLFGQITECEASDSKNHQRYLGLPKEDDIVEHYLKENSKSSLMFAISRLAPRKNWTKKSQEMKELLLKHPSAGVRIKFAGKLKKYANVTSDPQ